jgi:hypothetical protein
MERTRRIAHYYGIHRSIKGATYKQIRATITEAKQFP